MRASTKKALRQVKHHVLTAAPLTVGSPELGTPTLTVGQIVEQLGPVAPDATAMSERIRHWTREGLLLPVNQHHAEQAGTVATAFTLPTKRQSLMRSPPPGSN